MSDDNATGATHAELRQIMKLAKSRIGSERLFSQATRIIFKFGGHAKLHAALKAVDRPKSMVTLYRWDYPRTKEKRGSEGVIPASVIPDILLAARHQGIILSPEDLDPRPSRLAPERDGTEPRNGPRRLGSNGAVEKLRRKLGKEAAAALAQENPIDATPEIDIAAVMNEIEDRDE